MLKKYLLSIFICCFIFQVSSSQEITGIATYKSFMKFDVELDSMQVPKELQADLLKAIKQQTQKEYELHFSSTESVFKEKEQLAQPSANFMSGAMVSSTGGFGVSYKNLKENRYVTQRDLLGKLFLISDTLKNQEWSLEKETKNIGDYTCFKATRVRTSEDTETGETIETPITAWYTPQIPIATGPFTYDGLPGLILEITDGKSTYLCSQVVLNPKNGVKIEQPKKGKKVSNEEFEEIQAKKMKEMRENAPVGDGNSIEFTIQN
ncbi:GLPGLI family protein [Aequorivita marina]|uniref:GLPGLI family protein n=1 Tax=Aequorivita marina TaxID=3073654 RepID=UPI002874C3E6|nr:GLPGLI family protein [Aequorivita sp. S2608]MDS1297258.1 GLPGLI family protein [Aequorivita sp. S2608]